MIYDLDILLSEIEQICNTTKLCGIQTQCWGLIYKAAKNVTTQWPRWEIWEERGETKAVEWIKFSIDFPKIQKKKILKCKCELKSLAQGCGYSRRLNHKAAIPVLESERKIFLTLWKPEQPSENWSAELSKSCSLPLWFVSIFPCIDQQIKALLQLFPNIKSFSFFFLHLLQ